MSTQPNALRLADIFNQHYEFRDTFEAAAELRAQHELIQKLTAAIVDTRLLAVGYAASYKSAHGLQAFHPTHQGIIDGAETALAAAEAHK